MNQEIVTFYRIMNGYEFIEFMRKFGWKKKGCYKKQTLTDDSYIYYTFSNSKKNFEGWRYWFDAPFPTDLFDEEQKITFSMSTNRRGYFGIKEILENNGFRMEES